MASSRPDLDLRPLLDACPLAMIVLDSAGRILSASGGFLRELEWTPAQLVGRLYDQCVAPSTRPANNASGPRSSLRHRPRIRTGRGEFIDVEDEVTRLPVAGRVFWEVHMLRASPAPPNPSPQPIPTEPGSIVELPPAPTLRSKTVQLMLDHLPAGVAVFNEAGSFVGGNRAARALLGRPTGPASARTPNPSHSGPLAVSAVLSASIRHCSETRAHVVEKSVPWKIHGEIRHLDWRLQPLGPADAERGSGVLALIVDVTDRVRGEHALSETVRAAENASQRKSLFLSAVSHDLRTPVNTIKMHLDLLRMAVDQNATADDELAQSVTILGRSVDGLIEMLNDLLVFSHIDSGHLDDRPSSFALDPWLETTLAPHEAAAFLKQLQFTWRVDQRGRSIHCDRVKLTRILVNLVDNAVKFTEAGAIDVTARLHDEGNLLLAVRDTGPGIPADKLDCIFDEFTQLNNPSRDPSRGSGLGLAICRRLVESVGGLITVESRPGRGSLFLVRYPVQFAQIEGRNPSSPIPATVPPPRPDYRRMPLLIVADDPLCRQSIATFLKTEDYAIDAVANGLDALRWLDQTRPWLVLLDLCLPGLSGLELFQAIRQRREYREVPIVVFTNGEGRMPTDDFMTRNVEGVLQKPVDLGQLAETLRRIARRP